jgi:alkylhydroperoxidase/carboxymuconolactone decarboxylase family protein YurZ
MSDDGIWPKLERPKVEDRLDKARAIRDQMGIYGENGQSSEEFFAQSAVHTQGIIEWCFGMVWAETPFDMKTKEIIVLTTMAAQDLASELEWHVRVALNLGLTREEIVGIFVQATPYIGLPKANHAIRAAMRAFKKIDEGTLSKSD